MQQYTLCSPRISGFSMTQIGTNESHPGPLFPFCFFFSLLTALGKSSLSSMRDRTVGNKRSEMAHCICRSGRGCFGILMIHSRRFHTRQYRGYSLRVLSRSRTYVAGGKVFAEPA
jgi:hypothetical protein